MKAMIEVRGVDKSSWGPGEWQDEPDERRWVDDATDYSCEILRSRSGSLCGYVGVSRKHPLYDVDYDDFPADVHGGLTYSKRAICDDLWWFGFDCAHPGDRSPSDVIDNYRESLRKFAEAIGCDPDQANDSPDCVYRNIAYVTAQVESLARQLKAMEPTPIDPAATGR